MTWLCSGRLNAGISSDVFEAADIEAVSRAVSISGSDSSKAGHLAPDGHLSESASGIDLLLLSILTSSTGQSHVRLQREKPDLFSLSILEIQLRVNLLVRHQPYNLSLYWDCPCSVLHLGYTKQELSAVEKSPMYSADKPYVLPDCFLHIQLQVLMQTCHWI